MNSLVNVRRATRAWEPTTILRGTVQDARELLEELDRVVVLTGAGISTDSGVPDYRGPSAQRATPMLYSEFVSDEANRRRYWARNYQGWAQLGRAEPNPGHRALAAWERGAGPTRLTGLITQNVDGLHEAAGSVRLVTLHGRSADVVCLDCRRVSRRADLQPRLAQLNPGVQPRADLGHAELRPDADAVVDDWQDFVVPPCEDCGGVLKPDVVFFGEPVPRDRVEQAFAWCEEADALLVAGSSLTVMSGLRFARRMHRDGKPVLVVNRGATRADELATIRLDAGTSAVLPALLRG
ncbi:MULTISPECIES: Sir2 family NAD-dependent protein deacetylase [unclassified Luteococcus]|uniref:Sir2 family NAD-dependent protein deacetylase n=1 Tax=unclassified Luteococcus TaxID=2639923 RepID=UPI00313B708E